MLLQYNFLKNYNPKKKTVKIISADFTTPKISEKTAENIVIDRF